MNTIQWRDTARPLRFFFVDARVLVLLVIWACHMCLETFVIALMGCVFFAGLELFGLNCVAALRMVKNCGAGPRRPLELSYFALRRAQW